MTVSGRDPELDRRVRRTRRQLHVALVELTTELGYDLVTVEHLTNRADLARRTFYAHYVDKDALLEAVVSDLLVALVEGLTTIDVEPDLDTARTAAVRHLYVHGQDNRDCYRMILSGAGNGKGLRMLSNTLSDNVERLMVRQAGQLTLTPRLPLDFVARSFVGQHLTVLRWWLDHQTDYTLDELTTMRTTLMEYGEMWAMGFDSPTSAASSA